MSTPHQQPDLCPGTHRMHQARDGYVSRVRIPGGYLAPFELKSLSDLAVRCGAGFLDITSRANFQIRRVNQPELLLTKIAELGFLPSPDHDVSRNILARPGAGFTPEDHHIFHLVQELDNAFLSDPELAQLPGKFYFYVTDTPTELPPADIVVCPQSDSTDGQVIVPAANFCVTTNTPVSAALLIAKTFLTLRTGEYAQAWRIAELPRELHEKLAALFAETIAHPPSAVLAPSNFGSCGPNTIQVGPRLGRLTRPQADAIAHHAISRVQLTPWQTLIFDVSDATAALTACDCVSLITCETNPLAHIMACPGVDECAKARADSRSEAIKIGTGGKPARVTHVTACERHCGRPPWPHELVTVTESGHFQRV